MSDDHPGKSATIYDVAARAGVSHITVSRVVNGKQNVSPETRERVQKAMDELSYVPNPIAKTLQTRRSATIELITTNVWGSSGPMQSEIVRVAHSRNYQFTVLPTTPSDLFQTLKAIPNRMVAGTIVYAPEANLDYPLLQRFARQYPLVCMNGRMGSGVPMVVYDQYQGASMAVQHLIDHGHRYIAAIGGQQILVDGKIRIEAYRDTMLSHGLPVGPIVYGDFGAASGERTMHQLLALRSEHPFTAVVVGSDAMAAGAMSTIWRAGLRVPDDISVVGYDNDPYAAYLHPPLTSIENEAGVLGQLTAEYLFEFINDPETASRQQRVLLADLVSRESVRSL